MLLIAYFRKRLGEYVNSEIIKSLNETTCSSIIFIRRFMLSDLAKRMDSEGFLFDAIDVTDALCEIEEQFGPIQPENQVNRFIKSSNRMNYKNYTSLTTLWTLKLQLNLLSSNLRF